MKVSIRTIAATAFVALLVPLAAAAKEAEVNGPAALAGAGFFGGELTMELADGQRPVQLGGAGGYVGILDLGGDLKVHCQGKGRVSKKETDQGDVYMCAGRGGKAVILGSHFKFRGFATKYRALLPAGTSGTFHGRFVEQRDGVEERKQRRGEQKPGASEDDEVPTLAELAALLAGKSSG